MMHSEISLMENFKTNLFNFVKLCHWTLQHIIWRSIAFHTFSNRITFQFNVSSHLFRTSFRFFTFNCARFVSLSTRFSCAILEKFSYVIWQIFSLARLQFDNDFLPSPPPLSHFCCTFNVQHHILQHLQLKYRWCRCRRHTAWSTQPSQIVKN